MNDVDELEEQDPPLRSTLVEYPHDDDPYILNRTNTDDHLVADTPGIRKSTSIQNGQEESLVKKLNLTVVRNDTNGSQLMSANDSQIPLVVDDDDYDFSRKIRKAPFKSKKQTKSDQATLINEMREAV